MVDGGEYNDFPYYVQLHNVYGEAYYLFRVEKKWYVSLTLGDVNQWNIHNPSICEDIPRTGWKFKDFNGRSM